MLESWKPTYATGREDFRVLAVLLLLLALPAWLVPVRAAASATSGLDAELQAAIAGPQRSPRNVKRDRYRHPKQTLEFFGIRPDMTVVEVLPGGGWYTEILAPFLRDKGRLIEATYPTSSPEPFMHRMALAYREKLAADPAVYSRIAFQSFAPPDYVVLGPPDSADMVLTFRNMHDLVYANPHGQVTSAIIDRFFRAAYLVLKPGGVLGIVAHRADPSEPVRETLPLGRLPQAYVIGHAERAGFRLAAASEVNANPADHRHMPVWNLPPTLHAPEKDRARYQAIGEADNMTLRFVKPPASP